MHAAEISWSQINEQDFEGMQLFSFVADVGPGNLFFDQGRGWAFAVLLFFGAYVKILSGQ